LILGIDHDQPAVNTFAINHQSVKAVKMDLRGFNPSDLPNCDVLIGGPPCTQFSSSKSNKTRNVLDGLELVQSFLRAVYIKKPKYWVMENVAKIQEHLPKTFPLSWIGINSPGTLEVPNRGEFIAADYGVPQNRVRYLIGNFPSPKKSHISPNEIDLFSERKRAKWLTLRDVLNSFPDPSGSTKRQLLDPNYQCQISTGDLTDHFYDTTLNDRECRSLRKTKEEHPFMGYMPFFERLDRPARTVVATQLGRETLVLKSTTGTPRRLTVRECAVLQTFPITFQFMGGSYSSKYRLVGDAVPPKMAYAIANEIRRLENRRVRVSPNICLTVDVKAPTPKNPFPSGKRKHTYLPFRRFSEHIPGKEQRGCRSELDNLSFVKHKILLDDFKGVIWNARLYIGEGKNSCSYIITKTEAKNFLFASEIEQSLRDKLTEFTGVLSAWSACIENWSAKEVQEVWNKGDQKLDLNFLVDDVSQLINKHFPKSIYGNKKLKSPTQKWFPVRGIRLRILIGLFAASIIAEKFNS